MEQSFRKIFDFRFPPHSHTSLKRYFETQRQVEKISGMIQDTIAALQKKAFEEEKD
jgi:hypothetical protein